MAKKQYLQERITTGGLTLPVVIVFTLVWWFGRSGKVDDWIEPGIGYLWMCFNGFLLALINNRYSLIRLHTRFHLVLFLLMTTTLLRSSFSFGQAPLTCYLLMTYQLLNSYQRVEPVGDMFTGFLFIGIASLFFPPMLYFVPLLYIGAQMFQAFTCRTLFAGIVGLLLPYWLLLTYVVYTGDWNRFVDWAAQLQPVMEISYEDWSTTRIFALSLMILITFLGVVHCLTNNYADRIRTRFYLYYLVLMQIGTLTFLFLQPQHFERLFPITLAHAAIFGGHLFALNRSRISNVLFIGVMIVWGVYLITSLWIS